MKKIIQLFCLAWLSVGLLQTVNGQRRGASRSFSTHRSAVSGSQAPVERSRSNIASARPFNRNNGNIQRGTPLGGRSSRVIAGAPGGRVTSSVPPRQFTPGRNTNDRNLVRGYNRSSTVYRSPYYNNRSYYNNNSRLYSAYRRPVFMYGPRYTIVPGGSISIHFGGNPYYYHRGYFYGYYGGYYRPVFPPFGLHINVLPFGYSTIHIGTVPFFYYNGIYYRKYDDENYEVVDAPMGATVSDLPRGARSVVLNGEKLYELNGTYYQSDRDSKGRKVYVVVGKNGEINNNDQVIDNNDVTGARSLQIGDILETLPENSRVVTINGEKMFVTPDNSYLKEEVVNGEVEYRVVGQ